MVYDLQEDFHPECICRQHINYSVKVGIFLCKDTQHCEKRKKMNFHFFPLFPLKAVPSESLKVKDVYKRDIWNPGFFNGGVGGGGT